MWMYTDTVNGVEGEYTVWWEVTHISEEWGLTFVQEATALAPDKVCEGQVICGADMWAMRPSGGDVWGWGRNTGCFVFFSSMQFTVIQTHRAGGLEPPSRVHHLVQAPRFLV